ncbi:hypothetical protein CRUP_033668 [Coryphaenoides rupestris]|nr:hypothetical protein CRUP_033668 [Coryphaenoides rupestris]
MRDILSKNMYKIRQKTTTFNTADSLQVENSQAREILIRRHPTIRRSIRAGSFRDQSVPKSQRYYSLQAGANLDSAFPLRRTSHGSDITELRERRLHALQPPSAGNSNRSLGRRLGTAAEAVTARPRPHSPGLDVIDEIRGVPKAPRSTPRRSLPYREGEGEGEGEEVSVDIQGEAGDAPQTPPLPPPPGVGAGGPSVPRD